MLRRILGGPIRLVPKNGQFVAECNLTARQVALAAGTHIGHLETGGAGGGT